MLNVTLVGCGRIGRMHGRFIQSSTRSRLGVVYDTNEVAAAAVVDAGGARVAGSVEDVFTDPKVDAVVVAFLTSTHADYIERSVKVGKPVLCETPIDFDIERVPKCRRAIAGSGVPVQIGFNQRFDPGHSALRDAVAAGEIGTLVQVIVTLRDPAPPSEDYLRGAGGMFHVMTIHDFDLARFMLGDDEPIEVFALADALIDPDLGERLDEVDCATVLMRSRSGRQIVISNARQAPYGYDQRIEAVGTAGMLQSTNRTPHGLARFTAEGTDTGAGYEPFFIERYERDFALQLSSFLDAVETGTAPRVGFDDGLKASMLAEAAYASRERCRDQGSLRRDQGRMTE